MPIRQVFYEYFKFLAYALNPFRYEYLAERLWRTSFKHFFFTLLFILIIAGAILAPKIAKIPEHLTNQVDNFDKLEITFDQSMNKEIYLIPNNNLLVINTNETSNTTKYKDETIVVTGESISCNTLTCKLFFKEKIMFKDIQNLKQNKPMLKNLFTLTTLVMLPGIFLIAFGYYAIKYIGFILLIGIITFVFCKLSKFTITFEEITKIGLFASVFLMVEIVSKSLGANIYYLNYVAFAIVFAIGILKVGRFTNKASSSVDDA